MPSTKQKAYRWLLHDALIEFRSIPVPGSGWFQFWERQAFRKRCSTVAILADWLHNLALFSAIEFRTFDETKFWASGNRPEITSRYRSLFEGSAVRSHGMTSGASPLAPSRATTSLDDREKRSYRWLIYEAMLDIRIVGWNLDFQRVTWNIGRRRQSLHRVQYVVFLSHWLHNLAAFSAVDFVGFSPPWFWEDYRRFRERYEAVSPYEIHCRDYKNVFQRELER